METIRDILSNPLLLTILSLVGLLVVFFLAKRFFKIALLIVLLFVAAFFLYHGFTTPGDYKEKMKGAYDKTKVEGEEALKKGKDKLVEEGKSLLRGGKKPDKPSEE